jgi:hypothetical protein
MKLRLCDCNQKESPAGRPGSRSWRMSGFEKHGGKPETAIDYEPPQIEAGEVVWGGVLLARGGFTATTTLTTNNALAVRVVSINLIIST